MCRNIKTLFNFEPPATKAESALKDDIWHGDDGADLAGVDIPGRSLL